MHLHMGTASAADNEEDDDGGDVCVHHPPEGRQPLHRVQLALTTEVVSPTSRAAPAHIASTPRFRAEKKYL